MPLVLVPLNGDRPVPLDKAIVFFGRGQECDVILTNSRKVSRRHCCVAQIDDHYIVRDLGSMNGVRINGKLVKQEPLGMSCALAISCFVWRHSTPVWRRRTRFRRQSIPIC